MKLRAYLLLLLSYRTFVRCFMKNGYIKWQYFDFTQNYIILSKNDQSVVVNSSKPHKESPKSFLSKIITTPL